MKVKVCGITSYKDASLALDVGADALGLNFFARSPRFIDPREARIIVRRLPPFVATVGIFVNLGEPDQVVEIARESGVQVLQLHGDEAPDYCRKLNAWPLIKALRLDGLAVVDLLRQFPVQAFLLDAKDETNFGGTGSTFNWALAEPIKSVRPVILAGGLTPANVGDAIRFVRPYGVDVCSGVESSPGVKDAAKLRAFMDEVRNASKNIQP